MNIYFKNGENTVKISIRIYVNIVENTIIFKIKIGYYIEFLTPETMELLGSTKSKITKDKNGENVPNLEISDVVLVNCNVIQTRVEGGGSAERSRLSFFLQLLRRTTNCVIRS